MRLQILLLMAVLSLSVLFLESTSADSTTACSINVNLLNQAPYPAVPGDYVKIVFQATGLENTNCGTVGFEVLQDFPISFDPGVSSSAIINSGTFKTDYGSSVLLPFKVRVSPDALSSGNEIKIKYTRNLQTGNEASIVKSFDLAVNDSKTDFDVIINSYDRSSNTLTLGLINIGKTNAEALTIEIPQQDGINVTGGSKKIIGSLNSNDDTTVNFEAIPYKSSANVILSYNDINGVRRTLNKEISFSPSVFTTSTGGASHGPSYYLLIVTWLGIIAYAVYRYYSSRRKRKLSSLRRI